MCLSQSLVVALSQSLEVERPEDEESMQEDDPLEPVEAQGADNDLMDSGSKISTTIYSQGAVIAEEEKGEARRGLMITTMNMIRKMKMMNKPQAYIVIRDLTYYY
jgi:hypothetical protein